MKVVIPTGRFGRDVKKIDKRGVNLGKLHTIIELLRADTPLPPSARPHKLSGQWAGYWECHIEGDWLLIYEITDDAVILERTGAHIDLFE